MNVFHNYIYNVTQIVWLQLSPIGDGSISCIEQSNLVYFLRTEKLLYRSFGYSVRYIAQFILGFGNSTEKGTCHPE